MSANLKAEGYILFYFRVCMCVFANGARRIGKRPFLLLGIWLFCKTSSTLVDNMFILSETPPKDTLAGMGADSLHCNFSFTLANFGALVVVLGSSLRSV